MYNKGLILLKKEGGIEWEKKSYYGLPSPVRFLNDMFDIMLVCLYISGLVNEKVSVIFSLFQASTIQYCFFA